MKRATIKSVETRYYEERDALMRGLKKLDRWSFLKLSAAAAADSLRKLRRSRFFKPRINASRSS
ncbi:MAG: hypothetical protein LC647_04250 [Beggiatoa sp.]|nr:hypothetical protein [Beggiatoa sp.]